MHYTTVLARLRVSTRDLTHLPDVLSDEHPIINGGFTMSTRIVQTRTAQGWRLSLPADLRFEDYRELRAAILGIGNSRPVCLDLSRIDALPTWVIGFLLHVEESLGIRVQVASIDSRLHEIFDMTRTARFLEQRHGLDPHFSH
jgi:hypothetical protein